MGELHEKIDDAAERARILAEQAIDATKSAADHVVDKTREVARDAFDKIQAARVKTEQKLD